MRDQEGQLNRRLVAALASLVLAGAVAGCGLGPGEDVGGVQLTVTQDYGRDPMLDEQIGDVHSSDTVMRVLDRSADITTRYGGRYVGLVAAAILFGLLHPLTPTYAVLAALIGLYLGWLRMATGNLFVPITTHAIYDFLVLAYLVKWRAERQPVGPEVPC